MKTFEKLTARGKIGRLRKLALKALEQYDLEVERLRFLAEESSVMFRIDTHQGKKLVLRIYSEVDSSLQENLAETAWLAALQRETQVRVPAPLPNRQGRYVTLASVEGVPGKRRCAVYTWVPGRQLENYLTPDNYYRLGAIMAQLHDHAESWQPPPGLAPKRWDTIFYYPDEPVVYNRPEYSHLFPPQRLELIEAVIERAERLFKGLYTQGEACRWIHGDMHYWNVHYYRGELYVLDFEDITCGYPVQDIAIALYYGRSRDGYAERSQAFQQGYTNLRAWPVESQYQLETLWAARASNFINYAAWHAPEPQEYVEMRMRDLQEYLRKVSDGKYRTNSTR